jgi:hypothetical protein
MEGANEAARRAVNGVLDSAGFDGARCELWPLYEPEILAPWRLYDAERFKAGLPWDATLTGVAARFLTGSELLDKIRPLMETAAPYLRPGAEALDPSERTIEAARASNAADAPFERLLVEVPALEGQLAGLSSQPPGAGEILGPGGFVERMIWYREMISDVLTSAVPKWEPQRHLYALVDDFVARSGKGLRPALCIATARALGGRGEDALHAAAGLEMLHNAFLVHDDIEDGSDTRRGVATMHRRAGVPIAINVGDAMNALAMRLFRMAGVRLGPACALRILDEVDHLIVETLEGQAMELGWMRDNDLTFGPDDYLRLALKKTAWYSFIHPMRIGALVANGQGSESLPVRRLRLSGRTGFPNYRRRLEPERKFGALWQGNRRRSVGGQTDASPDPRASARQSERQGLGRGLSRAAARTAAAARGLQASQDHRGRRQHTLGAAVRSRARRGGRAPLRRDGVRGSETRSRSRVAAQLRRLRGGTRRVAGSAD